MMVAAYPQCEWLMFLRCHDCAIGIEIDFHLHRLLSEFVATARPLRAHNIVRALDFPLRTGRGTTTAASYCGNISTHTKVEWYFLTAMRHKQE